VYKWKKGRTAKKTGYYIVDTNPKKKIRTSRSIQRQPEDTLDNYLAQRGRSLYYISGCEILGAEMTNDPECDSIKGLELRLKVPHLNKGLTYFFRGSVDTCSSELGARVYGHSEEVSQQLTEKLVGKYLVLYVSTDRAEGELPLKTYGANPVIEGFLGKARKKVAKKNKEEKKKPRMKKVPRTRRRVRKRGLRKRK